MAEFFSGVRIISVVQSMRASDRAALQSASFLSLTTIKSC